jgi:hypothetical protein
MLPALQVNSHSADLRSETSIGEVRSRQLSTPRPHPEIFYAFLVAGTGIPAILRFTAPRKFQLVK